MRGAVASGHTLTSKAAYEMFLKGGNAFDAAVSAGFASVVVEPALTSFGGGGFMLAHIEKDNEDILFDFFVNTPGLGIENPRKPVMVPVDIQFPRCSQIFHTGYGSIAIPGMLKGMLHVHKRLGTLPLKTVLSPAISYLEEGVEISSLHRYFLGLLEPIFTSTEYGKSIYSSKDRIFNPLLIDFFYGIAKGKSDIYSGSFADSLINDPASRDGLITRSDLEAYEVIERKPLRIRYRDREILTNPPPSSGGITLALGLHLLENIDLTSRSHNSEEFIITLIELIQEMNSFKPMKNGNRINHPFNDSAMNGLIESFIKNVSEKTFISTQGTTHLSIIDEVGNAVSMTTSNGSGSGVFIPGTGIMLNNMMGEDDLHPDGFFSCPPNKRVSSMMMPSIVMKDNKVDFALGSGGSKRIKTAIIQALINLIDFNYPLKEAIEAPRIHLEDGVVQIESELPAGLIKKLKSHYQINQWGTKNMYFGGVHAVNSSLEGWGDSRRDGSFIT